jgi:hypothetical protein
MIKKLLFSLLFSLPILQGYSQKELSTDYKYEVSSPYKVRDAESKRYFSQGNEVMAIKFDKKIYIQKFNADKPEFISEKEFENKKVFPKKHIFEAVEEINKRFYVFYSLYDKDSEKEQLYAQEVDFAKGEFTGSASLLLEVQEKITLTSYSEPGYKFSILPTLDKKSFLVTYSKKPEFKNDKKSFDIIGLYSFDGNLKKISNTEITMPYTERRMDNLDYQIDNKANLYMLTKVYHDDSNDDKKSRNDTIANYHIELFTLRTDSDKMNITKIENKEKFITRLWMFDLPAGGSFIGGYYNNGKGRNFEENCDGIILFKIKEDGSLADQFTYEIPLDLINEYKTEKEQKKNAKKEEKGEGAKITNLKLKDLVMHKDGSIIIAGEQEYTITTTSTSFSNGSSSTHTSTSYFYNDIVVTKINPDGKLGWMKKIPKYQRGGLGKGGMSYKFFSNETDNFFVFLDNVKNIDLPLDKSPAMHSDRHGGYLTAVKINEQSGEITKGSILNAREIEDFELYQFSVDRLIKTSNTTFVLEAYKKKKEDVMIKVTLK